MFLIDPSKTVLLISVINVVICWCSKILSKTRITGKLHQAHKTLYSSSSHISVLFQKERETFLLDHTPDGRRMVSLSPEVEEPSAEKQVQLLHSALRQCLGLLHCVSQKEEEEWGKLEDDYESLKKNVLTRLEHLLYTTKDLAETEGTSLEVTPDHQCTEVKYLCMFMVTSTLVLLDAAIHAGFTQKSVIQQLEDGWIQPFSLVLCQTDPGKGLKPKLAPVMFNPHKKTCISV